MLSPARRLLLVAASVCSMAFAGCDFDAWTSPPPSPSAGGASAAAAPPAPLAPNDARPGIECGCAKQGIWPAPNAGKVIDAGKPGSGLSPRGKYRLTVTNVDPQAGRVHLEVKRALDDHTVLSDVFVAGGWGFSPDDDRFVVHGVSGGQTYLRLYDLAAAGSGRAPVTYDPSLSSDHVRVRFSPNGKYLLLAAVTNLGQLFVEVVEPVSGDVRYEALASLVLPPIEVDVTGWGWSPDAKDGTFLVAWQGGASTVRAEVVRLDTGRVLLQDDFSGGIVETRFSPCGDAFATIKRAANQIRLYATLDGGDLGSASASRGGQSYDRIESNGHHTVQYLDGSYDDVASNTAHDPCPGGNPGDTDKDGIPDANDVCPSVADPDQRDTDHDGVGDACEALGPSRAGMDCGCKKQGEWVAPNEGKDLDAAKEAGLSPKGKYRLTVTNLDPQQGRFALGVERQIDRHVVLSETFTAGGWGFSPDDDRFVVHGASAGRHTLFLYDLARAGSGTAPITHQSTTTTSHARVRFSPNGRSLVYSAITAGGQLYLELIDAPAGALRKQVTATPYLAPAEVPVAGWGWSPDTKDATFVMSWRSGQNATSGLALRAATGAVLSQPGTTLDSTSWLFPPCGDLVAELDARDADLRVRRSLDGEEYAIGSLVNGAGRSYSQIEANGKHRIYYNDGSALELAPNGAHDVCPTGAAVDQDGDGVADDRDVCPTVADPDQRDADGDGVGDACESSAADGDGDAVPDDLDNCPGVDNRDQSDSDGDGTGDACEAPDTAGPTWSAPLVVEQLDESRVRIAWPLPIDDGGVISGIEVFVDGATVASLGAEAREHVVGGLAIGRTVALGVEAVDAAGNRSARLQQSYRMRDLTPPAWPAPAYLGWSSRAPTRVTLIWSEANDAAGPVSGYNLYAGAGSGARLLTSTDGNTRSLTLTCLVASTDYVFSVQAVDADGNESTDGPSATVPLPSGGDPCQEHLRRVSLSSAGAQAVGQETPADPGWRPATSIGPAISDDGRRVAFTSIAVNLVPGDTNGVNGILRSSDVFLHDAATGETRRVSVASDGSEAPPGMSSQSAALSGDGRIVAFVSFAPNLVPNDGNGTADVFVHDTATGQTTRVSVSSSGEEADGPSGAFFAAPFFPQSPASVSVSGDGQVVVFFSSASNLVPGGPVPGRQIHAHDRRTGETRRVSESAAGNAGLGDSWGPAVSADGRFVAFISGAANLVPLDLNRANDVFVKDLVTGEIERVSVPSIGTEADSHSGAVPWSDMRDEAPGISGDGNVVVFGSIATNLAPGVSGFQLQPHVYRRDRAKGETVLVDRTAFGQPADNPGWNWNPRVSRDGRAVAFASYATDLLPHRGAPNVYVRDFATGVLESVCGCSCGSDFTEPDSISDRPVLSSNGRIVAFQSWATNLVPGLGDTNESADVFTFERTATFMPAADLALAGVASPDPATAGLPVTLTLTVANRGPDEAPDVAVTSQAGSGVELLAATTSLGSCSVFGGRADCGLGALGAGAQAVVQVTIRPLLAGIATNLASVTSGAIDSDDTNDEVFTTLPVEQPMSGDLDGNGQVDQDDVSLVVAARNLPAPPGDPRDLDGDGKITVLDARKLALLCTKDGCSK